MKKPILVDTDILIDFLRGHIKAIEYINAHVDRIILSSIVVAELYAGVKGDNERFVLDNFVAMFRVVPINKEIARLGGLYKREYGKSHGVGLADAILAATAEVEDAELKTLNKKHFPMINGFKSAYTK